MSLLEGVSAHLLKTLPREHFLRVRAGYLKLRRSASPVLRWVYGTFTTSDLINEIDRHLDRDWRILMVHSSVNNLMPMYQGNALELVRGLIEYCGPDRTLVMPAFNFGDENEGARETLSKNSRFDLQKSPSQMGLLTELFRRSKGVAQSRHPVYRIAALGPEAQALTRGHESVPSGIGHGTPFDYMALHGAHIVGIGKSFQVMTQAHHVEGLLGEEWPTPTISLPTIPVTVVDRKEEFKIEVGGRQQLWNFNIWKLRKLVGEDILYEWRYHNCPMFVARAKEVTESLLDAAGRGVTLYEP